VKFSKASLKQRIRNFIFGMAVLATGLTALLVIFQSKLKLSPDVAKIPAFFPPYFPGSLLLVFAGIAVMIKAAMPMNYELKLCLLCQSITKQFQADLRFRNGKKIGETYVCENCGQKYLVSGRDGPRR